MKSFSSNSAILFPNETIIITNAYSAINSLLIHFSHRSGLRSKIRTKWIVNQNLIKSCANSDHCQMKHSFHVGSKATKLNLNFLRWQKSPLIKDDYQTDPASIANEMWSPQWLYENETVCETLNFRTYQWHWYLAGRRRSCGHRGNRR